MAGVPQPVQTPIPGAGSYASADVLANQAYNNALAQLNSQRLDTLGQYGYAGTVDPTNGVLTNVHVDPNSIYGSLQQMLHNQAAEDQQAVYGAQDRGLVGGLAHQAASELRYGHGAQDTQLGTALEQDLNALQQQQQAAAETRDNTLWQDQQAAADSAIQQQEQETIDQLTQSLGQAAASKPKPQTTTPTPSSSTPKPQPERAPRLTRAQQEARQDRIARHRALERIIEARRSRRLRRR